MSRKLIVLIGILIAALFFFGQQYGFSNQKSTSHQHCQAALEVLTKAEARVAEAHKTNSTQELHAAITDLDNAIKETKEHINACMGKEGEHKH